MNYLHLTACCLCESGSLDIDLLKILRDCERVIERIGSRKLLIFCICRLDDESCLLSHCLCLHQHYVGSTIDYPVVLIRRVVTLRSMLCTQLSVCTVHCNVFADAYAFIIILIETIYALKTTYIVCCIVFTEY